MVNTFQFGEAMPARPLAAGFALTIFNDLLAGRYADMARPVRLPVSWTPSTESRGLG